MKKHILIIDDDKDTLESFGYIFMDAGYTISSFTEINDIKETVERYRPDLVILDYLLNGLNGGELCAQIKRNEKLEHLPVILISAHSSAMFSPAIYKCDEFIEKPFDLNYLTTRVEYHLKNNERRPSNPAYIKVELRKEL